MKFANNRDPPGVPRTKVNVEFHWQTNRITVRYSGANRSCKISLSLFVRLRSNLHRRPASAYTFLHANSMSIPISGSHRHYTRWPIAFTERRRDVYRGATPRRDKSRRVGEGRRGRGTYGGERTTNGERKRERSPMVRSGEARVTPGKPKQTRLLCVGASIRGVW